MLFLFHPSAVEPVISVDSGGSCCLADEKCPQPYRIGVLGSAKDQVHACCEKTGEDDCLYDESCGCHMSGVLMSDGEFGIVINNGKVLSRVDGRDIA